jgi:hypothetical protein
VHFLTCVPLAANTILASPHQIIPAVVTSPSQPASQRSSTAEVLSPKHIDVFCEIHVKLLNIVSL